MPDRGINERELDRFLNDVAVGLTADRDYDLDGEAMTIIQTARTMAQASLPSSSRNRLDAAIQAEIALAESSRERVVSPADIRDAAILARNGRIPPPNPAESPIWQQRWRRRLSTQLATAALVLLTLLGSFVAFGAGRSWRQGAPAYIPASGEIEEAPEPGRDSNQAPKAAPIAEFVWQANGGPDIPFIQPGQPAIDPQGNLWVPDSGYGQFLIFAPDGAFLETWGAPGVGKGEFDFGSSVHEGFTFGGVAFDAAGNLYVADTGNFRIQKFGPDRAFVAAWGSEGVGQGQFRRPGAIAVDDRGRVYVSDVGWGKIEVFDNEGGWLATWSGLGYPLGLAIDESRGNALAGNGGVALWVTGGGVSKFSLDGERLAMWNAFGPQLGAFVDTMSVAVDAQGRVYVSDFGADRIQVFSPDGAFLGAWGTPGDEPGQFQGPRGIVLDRQGAVYVTEDSGKRIQKFRLTTLDP